jgi:hypothetical protein
MEGGAIMIRNEFSTYDAFIAIIESLEIIPVESHGGFLFKGILKENMFSIWGGRDPLAKLTKNFILKLVLIHETYNAIEDETKDIFTEEEFYNEVDMQHDIFKNTIDIFFEPICPGVITSNIRNHAEMLSEFSSESIKEIVESMIPDIRFGVIIMEILEDFKVAKSYFPGFGTGRATSYNYFFGIGNSADDILTRNRILKNYAFQLVKLMMKGYRHGDPHLSNALVFENYRYIENYRVVLIDFGYCKKVRPDYSLNTMIRDETHWAYNIMKEYFRTNQIIGPANCMNFYDEIRERYIVPARIKYVEKLYESSTLARLKMMKDYSYSSHARRLPASHNTILDELSLISMVIRSYTPPLNRDENYEITMNSKCANSRILAESYFLNTSIDYASGLETDSIYSDTLRDLVPSPDTKMYTYVIGHRDGDRNVSLFVARIFNCLEYGTKHAAIIFHFNIVQYYGAGELKVEDDIIALNLTSGTLMKKIFENETPQQVYMRSEMCRRVVTNHMFGLPFVVTALDEMAVFENKYSIETFFTDEKCCVLSSRLPEEVRMLEFDPTLGEFDSAGGGIVLPQKLPRFNFQSENVKDFTETIVPGKFPEIVVEPLKDTKFMDDWEWAVKNGFVVTPSVQDERIEDLQKLLVRNFDTEDKSFKNFMESTDLLYNYINHVKYTAIEYGGKKRKLSRRNLRRRKMSKSKMSKRKPRRNGKFSKRKKR